MLKGNLPSEIGSVFLLDSVHLTNFLNTQELLPNEGNLHPTFILLRFSLNEFMRSFTKNEVDEDAHDFPTLISFKCTYLPYESSGQMCSISIHSL
eukprot:c20465_g1_i1 orf=232-516(+)